MKRKVIAALMTMLIIIISLTQINYSATTTRAALYLLNDGSNDAIEDASIRVVQTIQNLTKQEFLFKVEVENFQEEGTEVALILDNSFSMWSQEKIKIYQEKMINTVNAIYEKIPDTYMSLSGYSGIIQEMTDDKEQIIEKINNITQYEGVNASTGLNYAKDSFTGYAKNKHIVVFTDGEETEESNLAIQEIQADTTLYLTAVMMGENITKQTQYKQTTRTKVFMIEDVETYNFENLYTNVKNWVYSTVDKEINNVIVNGKYTDDFKNIFTVEIYSQPNLGQLVIDNDGYTLTVPQITTTKVTFMLKVKLNVEVDRTYIEKTINLLKSTTINYDNKRQEQQNLEDTEKTPIVQLLEHYTLEITAINKEFQEIKVAGVKCTVIQKNSEGNTIKTYENLVTDSNGKIIIDDFIHTSSSTLEITFNSTPKPYESKENETIAINKDAITGEITITDTTLIPSEGESVEINNNEKVISAKVAIPPKVIVFNVTKTDEETGEPLENVEFSLTQPQTDDIPANSVIYGTTNASGNTKISGEVAGIKQTTSESGGKAYYYTYVLKEETVPTGYIEEDTTTIIKVHFSTEGKITSAYIDKNGEIIDLQFENDIINIDLTNKMKYYTLNINAIDEEYNEIPVAGAQFQVTGINESGVEVVNKQETTDQNGNLQLEISGRGKVTYTIKQIPEHAAYETMQDMVYVLTRDYETNELTLNNASDNFELDNENKVLTATIPLTPKKFTIKIYKRDLDEHIPVKGVGLKLIQPDGRDEIELTTGNDGVAEFKTNIICEATGGENTYILQETQKATGYQQLPEQIPMKITFDSTGNITEMTEESDYLETLSKETYKLELKLTNEQQKYSIKIQTKHKYYNDVPVDGANLKVSGRMADQEELFYQSNILTTDSMGIAVAEGIKKSGDIVFRINVGMTPLGYEQFGIRDIKINKNLETENLTLLENENEDVEVTIDNTEKVINVILYFQPQTFTVEINKEDNSTPDTYLGGATFTITQPDIKYINEQNEETIQQRNIVTGVTEENKTLKLKIENPVLRNVTERTFSYVLSETVSPEGYEDTSFKVNFKITIDDDGEIIESIGDVIEESQPVEKGEITESKDDITEEEQQFLKQGILNEGKIKFTIANKQKGATLNVLAIDKKYKTKQGENIPVEGVTIQVTAQDSKGNEFYSKDLITDENGYIQISGISQTGDFSIKLKAIKTPAGYVPGSTKTINLYRDVLTTEITIKDPDDVTENEEDNKIINTKLPIDLQTFNLEVTKLEKLYGDTLIQDAEITIIQPKIEKYEVEREKIKGKTVKNEKLIMLPEVAGEGTYNYTISEKVPDGYIDSNINTTLEITFDELGEIINVVKSTDEATVATDSIVTLGEYTETTIPLSIMNEQIPYTIRIKALDSKCKQVPIKNVSINLTGTSSDGKTFNKEKITDETGIIEYADLNLRGNVDYLIEQIKVPVGYKLGQNKTIRINKDWDTTKITLREEVENVKIDNVQKIITIEIYIEPQTFEIHLDKVDKLDNSIYVPGATFELTQPKFETNQDRNKYTKTTTDGTVVFTAEVAGTGGPYTYTLTETVVPNGYLALSKTTNLNVTFDENGNVESVENQGENEFVNIGEIATQNVIPVQISNEKKVHSIKIVAMNEEDHNVKVEGVNIKLVGKDSSGITIIERTGKTDSDGIIIFEELIASGDITYEIIQEEPRPAAFYLGETKTLQIYIDEETNKITNNTNDEVTSVNNYNRQISTEIYLTPKKFTITLNKIDYDNKNLIGNAYIKYDEAKWDREIEGYTENNKKYVITGYVPGEGEYSYGLDEGYYVSSAPGGHGIPTGYKNYLNTHELKIEFDSNGDIINKEIVESRWFKVFWNEIEHTNSITEYNDLKYHTIKILNEDENTNDIELELTNVKKQFTFNLNVINSKYTNERIPNVEFRIIAQDENGNEIYNQVHTTNDQGKIEVGDQDVFRETGEITFQIECLNKPSMFKEIPIATVVVNRQEFPGQEVTVDETKTSSHVTATASPIEDEYNTSDFSYSVDVEVPLPQKTFDLELTKVNSVRENILLKGAKFTLTQPDEKHFQTEVTGEDGKMLLSADLYGETTEYKYVLTEIEAPEGHQLLEDPIEIYVSADDENVISARIGSETLYANEPQVENSKKVNITVKNDAEPGYLFNVKLIETAGTEKVQGSKYNININVGTNEKLNVTDYTDANGTIEITKVPGSGEIEIKINHLENAPGYKLIEGERIAVIDKDPISGEIQVVQDKTSEDLTVTIQDNTVIIQIDNTPTTRINEIEYEAVDKNNESIKIKDVDLNILAPNLENVIYKATDSNGLATVENTEVPGEGTYEYSTTVTSVPETYLSCLENIKVGIKYENGIITDIQKVSESDNYDVEYEIINKANETTYKAKIKIKIEPKTTYDLKIITQEKDNPDIRIEGAEFEITLVINNAYETKSTATTDSNGEAVTKQVGGNSVTIYLKQTKTSSKYVLDQETKKIVLNKKEDGTFEIDINETTDGLDVSILDDGTVQVIIENELKGANVNFQIVKLDSSNEAIRLGGVKLKLVDETNSKEYELTTDESGQVLLEGFKVNKPGEYNFTLTELTTVEGYDLPEITEGIRFKIIYERVDDELQVKDIIQENGKDVITGISYTQIETETDLILQFKLLIENQMDSNYKYTVNVYKRDKDTKELLKGAKFEFKSTFGENNTISTTIQTGEDGVASFDIPLVSNDNTFELKEITAPSGYKLDETLKTIVLNKDETTGEITISNLNNIESDNINITDEAVDIYIDNESIFERYQLKLTKIDLLNSENILSGAKYNIKIEADDGYTREEVVTTDKEIETILEGLEGYGNIEITLTEIEAPSGYKLNDPITINVNRDEETNEITFVDKSSNMVDVNIEDSTISIIAKDLPKGSKIIINKVDKKDESIVLPNVEFTFDGQEISTNEDGQIKGYATIEEGVLTKVFTIIEQKTLDGYELCPEVKLQVTYNDNGDVTAAEIAEGQDFARVDSFDENTVNITITNEKIEYYGIEIVKQDKDNNEIKIENTKFHVDITNGENSTNYDVTTNSYGIANITSLTGYGNIEIKVVETEVPSKYILDTEEKVINITRDKSTKEIQLVNQNSENYIVEVNNDEKVVKITVSNKPVKTGIDIEKVDSEDNTIKLKDVKFEVEILENKIQLTTDENGLASTELKDLERNNTYEIVVNELLTASGYKLNQTPIKISLEIDDLGNIKANLTEESEFVELKVEENRIKLVIKNEKMPEDKYIVEFEKQSNLSENIKLGNAKYEIKIDNGEEINTQEIITNSLGIAQIQDMIFDKVTTITVTEKQAPTGYELDEEEKQFTVQLNEDNELVISNIIGKNISVVVDDDTKTIKVILIDKSKGINFEIEKVDKNDETIKLSNVEFKIEDKQGKTDENGLYSTYVGDKLVNTKKIYTIEEISISSEYVKLDIPTQIEVTYDEQANISNVEIINNKEYVEYIGIENDTIKLRFKNIKAEDDFYKVEIIKKDKNNKDTVLAGAKYEVNIESEDGFKKQAEITTNDSGMATLEELKGYGNINIQLEEKEAPANYKIDQEKKVIDISRNKETKEITLNKVDGTNTEVDIDNENKVIKINVFDEPITFDLNIIKVDKDDNSIKLSGVEFEILGTNYTTDENGEINFKVTVPEASKEYGFEVKETKTLSGYTLIENIKLAIQIDSYGNIQKATVIEGQENVTATFEKGILKLIITNEKIPPVEPNKYDIIIEKVDMEDITKLLANAKFNISLKNSEKEILNKEYTTDNDGKIYLDSITQDDTYTLKLKELVAPNGYISNENDEQIVFVAKDGILTVNKELSSENVIIETKDNNIMKIIIKNKLQEKDEENNKGIFKLHIEKYVSKVNDKLINNTEPKTSITDGKVEYKKEETDPIHVQNGNIVIYTLRIYNEGNLGGYAESIQDNIPEGLEFLEEHEINKTYGWKKIDKQTVETNILSQEVSENNVIEGLDDEKIYYKDVQIAFRVINLGEDKEITNTAIINKAKDINGKETEVDSKGEATVKVDYFDLSVQKYVSNIIVRKDGVVTKNITANKNNIPKVEIRKKELANTTVQVEYTIVIKNEGNVEGQIQEIKDYIPDGMAFNQNDNANWSVKNNVATYKEQEMIKPQETKVITIKLNWNSNFATGLKENIVEVSGQNESNILNNRDTAQCFIITATGIKKEMIILPISILSIFGLGIYGIKKYVI